MVAGPLVIGIGNPDRGDDAAGLDVARLLGTRRLTEVRVVEHDGEPAGLLDWLGGADRVFIVDACAVGEPPGTIRRFDVAATALPPAAFACSTHGMGLADAVELARVLGRLPRHCVVYAIEGRNYEHGAALSPEVAAAAEEVANLIRDELRQPTASRSK